MVASRARRSGNPMSPNGGKSSADIGRPPPDCVGRPRMRSHAYHLAVFRSADRTGTRAALERDGIATAVHYPLAIPQQPAYRNLTHASCPQAEGWADECISVPCFPEMTGAEVDRVCTALAGLVE